MIAVRAGIQTAFWNTQGAAPASDHISSTQGGKQGAHGDSARDGELRTGRHSLSVGERKSWGSEQQAQTAMYHAHTTSVPKSHIQISMVWYSPMIRRYLSHSRAPGSAILAHDTKISLHYMGAQKSYQKCNFGGAEPLTLFGRPCMWTDIFVSWASNKPIDTKIWGLDTPGLHAHILNPNQGLRATTSLSALSESVL